MNVKVQCHSLVLRCALEVTWMILSEYEGHTIAALFPPNQVISYLLAASPRRCSEPSLCWPSSLGGRWSPSLRWVKSKVVTTMDAASAYLREKTSMYDPGNREFNCLPERQILLLDQGGSHWNSWKLSLGLEVKIWSWMWFFEKKGLLHHYSRTRRHLVCWRGL